MSIRIFTKSKTSCNIIVGPRVPLIWIHHRSFTSYRGSLQRLGRPKSLSRLPCSISEPLDHIQSSRTELPASFGVTALIVTFVLSAGGAFLANYYLDSSALSTSTPSLSEQADLELITSLAREEDDSAMASAVPPGRPGNLTPAQAAKLKEFWEALFKLADVYPGTPATTRQTNGEPGTPPRSSHSAESPDSGKQKRRRFGGLLSRKDKHEESPSDASSISGSIASSLPTNDKHGLGRDFKLALESQTPEQLRQNMWDFTKCDDPDGVLLRYLRARKWDVQAALVMMIATIHWRSNVIHLDDDVMLHGEVGAINSKNGKSVPGMDQALGKDFMSQINMGKSFLHGVDKEGRPLCYVRVRLHRAADQSEKALERYTVWTIETARLLLRPPVDTAVIIFDMTGFGMANMDYTPIKFMIKCFEANYPESLGHVLVHKAPWIFNSIWGIIKGWLDPVVASKIHFTKNVEDLSEFIDKDKIIKELGGEEKFEYHYPEPSEENDGDKRLGDKKGLALLERERNGLFDEFQKETAKWCGEDAGSAEEAASAKRRQELAEKLRASYWKMDPYVRARSMYDRMGVIKEGGTVDFYPERKHKGPLDYREAPKAPGDTTTNTTTTTTTTTATTATNSTPNHQPVPQTVPEQNGKSAATTAVAAGDTKPLSPAGSLPNGHLEPVQSRTSIDTTDGRSIYYDALEE